MSCILVTGASGFIGRSLAEQLTRHHEVICMSRRDPEISAARFVSGEFSAFEDLRGLAQYPIDAVVHLAAETGGCTERSAMHVNAEGTRCLMRYLIDRGCKKFVMASSIALVGFQSPEFRPLKLPVPDDHPCLDRHAYGFSKHMMEQVTDHMVVQNPDIEVTNFRLSTVVADDAQPASLTDLGPWSLGSITLMLLPDAIKLFTLAVQSPVTPGLQTVNATCQQAWCTEPTARILRHWWGDSVDVSHFEHRGHEYDSAYDVSLLKQAFGFSADRTLEVLSKHVS